MSLVFSSPITALSYGSSINVAAYNGTTPYSYTLATTPYNAGGSITTLEDGSVTYTAPASLEKPENCIAEIVVTDAEENTASLQLVIGDYQTIFCDILAHELNLYGRVFLANQKFEWPKDAGIFLVIDPLTFQTCGNNIEYKTINNVYCEVQRFNASGTISVNIYSRGPAAGERKEEVLMALASTYSRNQQSRNGMQIGIVPSGNSIRNLSELDGNAMMNRFNFDVRVSYSKEKIKAVDYFDSFRVDEKINA